MTMLNNFKKDVVAAMNNNNVKIETRTDYIKQEEMETFGIGTNMATLSLSFSKNKIRLFDDLLGRAELYVYGEDFLWEYIPMNLEGEMFSDRDDVNIEIECYEVNKIDYRYS